MLPLLIVALMLVRRLRIIASDAFLVNKSILFDCAWIHKMETHTKLFFAANLTLIVVSLFSWIIKWFYRPRAYRDHFEALFPGQFYVGLLFLIQVFEFPYLLDLGAERALRYSNAFSLLITPPVMLFICDKFFFPKTKTKFREFTLFIPAVILFVIFLLRMFGIITFSPVGRQIFLTSTFCIFLFFFFLIVRMALKIGRAINAVEHLKFSDEVDNSQSFAKYTQWLPTVISIIIAVNFLFQSVWVKFFTDIIFTIGTVAFVMFTLDPWREIKFVDEERVYEEAIVAMEDKTKHRMSDSRFEELKAGLLAQFDNKEIFLTPHLTLDVLLKELSTNRNYLCETISRAGYKSFYDMVNSYRVKYAIGLIKNEPSSKMLDIALRSGFASAASMNKAFTQQGFPSPSQHR